jgi:hypothetical protein
MRQALNNNPKVQAGVIAVLILIGVFMFMRMSSGGGDVTGAPPGQPIESSATGVPTDASGASGAGVAPAPATATDPAAAGAATATAGTAGIPAAPVSSTGVTPEALVPGPGLPADVARAFARGDAIVLLIVKPGATDDNLVTRSVAGISRSGVAVFVTPASKVARYSRIASGAGVTRTPALVVVRPRSVGGDVPQAIVSYGFRNSQSVIQAVEDALYRGRENLPYHPG